MDIIELMKERHSVRQYKSEPIEEEKKEEIRSLANEIGFESGLSFQVFFDEPKCFSSILARYGKFENVANYICIVGNKRDQEKAGYYGEKLVLKCQEIGLNTCWVALTHGKTEAAFEKGKNF